MRPQPVFATSSAVLLQAHNDSARPQMPVRRPQTASDAEGSNQLRQQAVPVDVKSGYGGERGLAFELEDSGSRVPTPIEPVDHQCSIPWIYEPGFTDTGALVDGKLDGLVVTCGAR